MWEFSKHDSLKMLERHFWYMYVQLYTFQGFDTKFTFRVIWTKESWSLSDVSSWIAMMGILEAVSNCFFCCDGKLWEILCTTSISAPLLQKSPWSNWGQNTKRKVKVIGSVWGEHRAKDFRVCVAVRRPSWRLSRLPGCLCTAVHPAQVCFHFNKSITFGNYELWPHHQS